MQTREIRIVVWVFVSILITLSVLGFASKADLRPSSPVPPAGVAPPLPKTASVIAETPIDPLLARSAGAPPAKRARLQTARVPVGAETLPERLTVDLKCPLDRVALVRGSDAEASEGGGFFAARKNGIHAAVDLNGSLGETVFAVADGKVITAGDWGKLGHTVIIDHLDGGYTIYGHLQTVDVKPNSVVTAGHVLGTMGYTGNARALQTKNLPPHLHFAYFRGGSPLTRIRDSADGLRLAGAAGALDPTWAVGFHKCWEEPIPAKRSGQTVLTK